MIYYANRSSFSKTMASQQGVHHLSELFSDQFRQQYITNVQDHEVLKRLNAFGILADHHSNQLWAWHIRIATNQKKDFLHITG